MTLINYLSRMHFADGVLEVALGADLELSHLKRPLLVSESSVVTAEFSERISSGLPYGCEPGNYLIHGALNREKNLSGLIARVREFQSDVLIAFGTSDAILLADSCCHHYASKANASPGSDGSSTKPLQPKLFAVPGVDGLPALSNQLKEGVRRRTGLSSLSGVSAATVIIDPTLIMGESISRTASSAANTIARCLGAFLSHAYNPPADAIAIAGYKRIARQIPELVFTDSLEMRRELMAASLNATLSMEKEPGVAHSLCKILMTCSSDIDEGSLMRLLIIAELELLEQQPQQNRIVELRKELEMPANKALTLCVAEVLGKLPLPGSLSELGIDNHMIKSATSEILSRKITWLPSERDLVGVLKKVDLRSSAIPECEASTV